MIGGLSTSTATQEGSAAWTGVVLTAVAVALVAVFRKAQMITLGAMTAVAWMVTETSTSALAGVYRVAGGRGAWGWPGRGGADPAESTAGLITRRLRNWLAGDR